MTQKTTCPVKESSNLESEKSHGAETSKNEADLPDKSLSPKDTKVEIDAKTDGNTTDTAGTESKQSEEDIENPSESDSDDSGDSGQKVLWLTFFLDDPQNSFISSFTAFLTQHKRTVFMLWFDMVNNIYKVKQ